MAQNDPDYTSQQSNDAKREAEEVEESIVRKELQNSILWKLVEGIRKQDTPTNTDEAYAGLKDEKI